MRGQSGGSLLSVMVATAIVGVIAAAVATFSVNGLKATKKQELNGERETVRNTLLTALDCAQTMGTKGAGPGKGTSFSNCSNLKLKNQDGVVLTGSGGKLGDFTVTPSCTTLGLRVTLTRSDGAGGFLKDPLHQNQVMGPQHPKAVLFGNGTELCQDYVNGNQTKKVYSGVVNVYWVNGQTNSPMTHVNFPSNCKNPVVVTQPLDDGISCSTGAAPFKLAGCYNMPASTSQDLNSRAVNVTGSGFDVFESADSAVCIGVAGNAPLGTACQSASKAYPVSYIATCDP